MRTYHLDLDDIAVLLRSKPQHIADWLIGAAPRPQSAHTIAVFDWNAAAAKGARRFLHETAARIGKIVAEAAPGDAG